MTENNESQEFMILAAISLFQNYFEYFCVDEYLYL